MKTTGITLIVSFMILSLIACHNKSTENKILKSSENSNTGLFLIHIVSVRHGEEKKFIDHLDSMYLPAWSDLHNRGKIYETSVFQIKTLDSLQTETPSKDFLILIHLSPNTFTEHLPEAEIELKEFQLYDKSYFSVIRSEIMAPTKDSYFPMTASHDYERVEEIDFFVEFIDVNNSPEDLEQYHSLMSSYFGPANGILVEKNLVFSFMAFETKKVISITDDKSSWNQIHISGDYPEYLDLNWDSLYTDLFRKELSLDLDSIWDLLPGIRELPPYYSGHFIKELHLH